MNTTCVGALQIGSSPEGTGVTLEKILSFAAQIKSEKLDLVVMPEAVLSGYPKGEGFGTLLGYRLQEGREAFARYFEQAIAIPGPLRGEEGLITAEIDLATIPQARYDLDAVGHYARPDVFQLKVDTEKKTAVSFE